MIMNSAVCFTERKRRSLMLSFVLCVAPVLMVFGVFFPGALLTVQASQIAENQQVVVGDNSFSVRALNQDFSGNAYLSLRDLAVSLGGTAKEYELFFSTVDGEEVVFVEEGPYQSVGGENTPFDETQMEECDWVLKYKCSKTRMSINGQTCYVYGITANNAEGNRDFYMSTGEVAVIMNLKIAYEDGVMYIDPEKPCHLNIEDMSDDGFFYMTDSCLVGDATTGQIYYSQDADKVVSIASTTKLMTYYVIMDGVSSGEITLEDVVNFSEKVQKLSETADGVVTLKAGDSAPITDVIKAMLIKSSNECALALAEHLCKDEEAFVERMNAKVKELGLSDDAYFYNPHGLPVFKQNQVMSAKIQNRMTAEDMFLLVSNLLTSYPQVTEITSIKKIHLDSFMMDFKNTNMLLHNIPEVVGLKTGTTTKAGSCLVAASLVQDEDGKEHYIVSIEYGAENAQIQSYTSLILMSYGLQEFRGGNISKDEAEQFAIPQNAEELMQAVIRSARKQQLH